MVEDDLKQTKLQTDDVDLRAPLSSLDWEHLNSAVTETEGMAWVQFLPKG